MKYDEILVNIGEFGPYQKRVFFLLMLPPMIAGAQVFSAVFTMALPPYRCRLMDYDNDTYQVQSSLHGDLVNLTIPSGGSDVEGPYDECHVFSDVNVTLYLQDRASTPRYLQDRASTPRMQNSSVREKTACRKWVYDRTEFTSTMMTEFDAVCGDKILRSHSHFAMFAGGLIGAVGLGLVADLLGRKVAIMISILLNFASTLGMYLAPDFRAMIPIKAVGGIATHSMFQITATTGIELVGPNKRTLTGMVVELAWTVGTLLLLPVAWLLREWRYTQLVLCLANVPLLTLWCLIPESPRWLLEKQRFSETQKVMEKICKSNNTKLPGGAVDAIAVDSEPEEKIWGMFTHRKLVVRSLVIFFNWLAVNCLYYGVSLGVGNLGGSTYLNYLYGVLVEMAGYLIALVLLDRTGRRRLHCGMMLIGGVACLAVTIPVKIGGDDLQWLTILLAMVGKLCVSGSYGILYIMSAELFPTVLRNSAIGVCSIFENVGGMASPYVSDLGVLIGGPMAQALPMIVFGVMSISAGLLSLLLPETLHRKLPETIQDAIHFDNPRYRSRSDHHDRQEGVEIKPLTRR